MSQAAKVRSVVRAIDILMVLSDGPQPLGVVATRTDLAKGTAHRLLTTLAQARLVVQDDLAGTYRFGPEAAKFAMALETGRGGFCPAVRKTLQWLRDFSGETVTLHFRIGDYRVCAEELESRNPVRYVAGLGSSAPLHVGSAGKVLLAFSADEFQAGYIVRLEHRGEIVDSPSSPAALRDELAQIRQSGWAHSIGERVAGASAMSAPIVDAEGQTVAALSVLGPQGRLTPARVEALAGAVVDAASEVSSVNGPNSNEWDASG